MKALLNRDKNRLVALYTTSLTTEPKLRTFAYDLGEIFSYDDLKHGASYDSGTKLWTVSTTIYPYKRQIHGSKDLGFTDVSWDPPRGTRGETRYQYGRWQVFRKKAGWQDLPAPLGVHT